MVSQKVENARLASSRCKPESGLFNIFWMPDQVRHDEPGTFDEAIESSIQKKCLDAKDTPFQSSLSPVSRNFFRPKSKDLPGSAMSVEVPWAIRFSSSSKTLASV